jgi:D-amino peptidase
VKIFISADIEGVAGATDWDEVTKNSPEYPEFQKQMTREVSAACQGAFTAGATEIIIKDAHSTARNLIAADLPENTSLVRGWSRHPYMMMQGLDSTFDAIVLIGYHSMAGSVHNPLAHTLDEALIFSMTINDLPASEFFINCHTAALENVPVVFISGDEGICEEARTVLPGITGVAVKKGSGASTVNLHPQTALDNITAGVQRSLSAFPASLTVELPEFFSVKITYCDARKAYHAAFYPGAEQVSARTIQFETPDYFEVLRLLLFVT